MWRKESSNQYINEDSVEEDLNVEKHIGTLMKQNSPLVIECNNMFTSGNLRDEYIEIHF